MADEERNALKREQEWLAEYQRWLGGEIKELPRPVSHPQHADAVKGWVRAIQERESAMKKLEIISEKEAACCPEDVAFDEQIKYLQFCIKELEEKLCAATGPGEEIQS